MTLAITGASGTLGRLVAEHLLADSAGHDVVLITRDPSKLADLAARGAEVRAGDFEDPATLPAAFAGVDRLLLISAEQIGTRVPGQLAAIDAAAAAGVGFVAYTSLPDPSDSNPAIVAADHRATEDHLRASGVAWTFLRNAIYAEIFIGSAQGALHTGTLLSNEGTGRTSHIARADCAAVAAAVLIQDGHENRAYDVTGPEQLTAADRAALLTEVTGTPVQVLDVDDAAYTAALVEHAGFAEPLAAAYATFGASARNGYADAISDVVERLTGRPPQPLRAVLAEALQPVG